MPAILAMAYHSLVGSSGPVSSASSRIGCGASLRIDAARAQEQQALDAGAVRGLDDVGLDHQVVVEEVGRIGVVGQDAADLGRREDDRIGLLRGDEALDLGLPCAGRARRVAAVDDRRSPALARRRTRAEPDHARCARRPRCACRPARAFSLTVAAVCGLRTTREVLARPSRARGRRTLSVCVQPSFSRALAGSPSSRSTSVGRK